LINLMLKVSGAGWVGVDLFFALSGFLITGILFDSVGTARYLRNFYLRRACRIFPLYYGFILLLVCIFTVIVPLRLRPLSFLPLFMQNTPLWWSNIHGGRVADASFHLWSLAVEEQFYLVWPLVIFVVRERRRLLWIAAMLACAAPLIRIFLLAHGSPLEATYKLTFCRMDALLGGAWLALMVRGAYGGRVQAYAPKAFLIAVTGCLAIAWRTGDFYWERNLAINRFGYSLLAIAATSLIAMALNGESLVARVMTTKPLRFVGRYSFGLYLFQPLVSVLLAIRFARSLHAHIASPLLYRVLLESIVLAITFAVALLSFRYFETPFLRLKRFGQAEEVKEAMHRPQPLSAAGAIVSRLQRT
jgi:peptidoglycan/LPS O-acetylase OafA/YrhL